MENITKVHCINRAMPTNKIFLALLKANLPFEISLYYNLPQHEISSFFHRELGTVSRAIQAPITIIDGKTFAGGWSAFWYICENYLPELVQDTDTIKYIEWVLWIDPLYGMLSSLHYASLYSNADQRGIVRKRHLSEFKTFNRMAIINDMLKESDYLYNNRRSIYDLALFSFIWPLKESAGYNKIWTAHLVTDESSESPRTYDFSEYIHISSWYDRMKKEYMSDPVSIIKTTFPELHEQAPPRWRVGTPTNKYNRYTLTWQPMLIEK